MEKFISVPLAIAMRSRYLPLIRYVNKAKQQINREAKEAEQEAAQEVIPVKMGPKKKVKKNE